MAGDPNSSARINRAAAEAAGEVNPRAGTSSARIQNSPNTVNSSRLPVAAPLDAPSHVYLPDDQQTLISRSSPLRPTNLSDSAFRIAEGRILPGDSLEYFELQQYVGGGGMGRVFRALDTRLSRTVALKILCPDHATDDETVQRFINEAQSAARLAHENIVQVHYVGEDRGIHFIAFEYVEGSNVRSLVERRGPLTAIDAIYYVMQIAEALAHAASRNVVHRDIKPSNVIITPEGRVKLIDMGLARMERTDQAAGELTASGVTLGTFDYISPEQARDPREADIRSDIYSLGCTLYFMLATRPPFPEGTALQKLLRHQSETPADVRSIRPDLPPAFNDLLQKMLAKDPDRRQQTPGELIDDLVELAQGMGFKPESFGRRFWNVGPKPRETFIARHLPWLASVVALILIVLGLEVYWSLATSPRNNSSVGDAPTINDDFAPRPAPIPSSRNPDRSDEGLKKSTEPRRIPSPQEGESSDKRSVSPQRRNDEVRTSEPPVSEFQSFKPLPFFDEDAKSLKIAPKKDWTFGDSWPDSSVSPSFSPLSPSTPSQSDDAKSGR